MVLSETNVLHHGSARLARRMLGTKGYCVFVVETRHHDATPADGSAKKTVDLQSGRSVSSFTRPSLPSFPLCRRLPATRRLNRLDGERLMPPWWMTGWLFLSSCAQTPSLSQSQSGSTGKATHLSAVQSSPTDAKRETHRTGLLQNARPTPKQISASAACESRNM
ncbi:hypothetical protein VTN49DRAFT_4634 [Thermomyces lanuginosus]|uniref:uncharacterized protein n=1 Tax=Thermomyces lanuginosus TaxID=5541 RepID=UPI003744A3E9